jgi:hypothetical protein
MDDKRAYRDIEIPGNQSLYRLAEAIVASFDFDFDHAFGFYSDLGWDYYDSSVRYELFTDMEMAGGWVRLDDQPKAGSVKRTKIAQALGEPGRKMQFVFDYGDDWRFEIEVKDFGAKAKGVKYPRILAAKGTSPEQYPDWEGD